MWFKLVINFMLPMEHPLIMLKTQLVIHYKIHLMLFIMECPKLCSTIFTPEWNTFKITPSNVDSLKIGDNVWFNVLTLCWNPAIVRIRFVRYIKLLNYTAFGSNLWIVWAHWHYWTHTALPATTLLTAWHTAKLTSSHGSTAQLLLHSWLTCPSDNTEAK
jgi:hypothetical protein